MEDNNIVKEEDISKEELLSKMLNDLTFMSWKDIKNETKSYMKNHFPRYIICTVFSFLMFLLTFGSLFIPLIKPLNIEMYIFSFILFIGLFVLVLYPSFTSLYRVVLTDSLTEAVEKPLVSHKEVIKKYFKTMMNTYGINKKGNTLISYFLFTLIFSILFFIAVMLPVIYFNRNSSSEVSELISSILTQLRMRNLSDIFATFIKLLDNFKFEVMIVNSIILFICLAKFYYNFVYYVRVDSFGGDEGKSFIKLSFRLAIFKNKFSFAAYFGYLLGIYTLIFLVLFAGFNVLFYFVSPLVLFNPIFAFILSLSAMYLLKVVILKHIIEICYSFEDIFLSGHYFATVKGVKKARKKLTKDLIRAKALKDSKHGESRPELKDFISDLENRLKMAESFSNNDAMLALIKRQAELRKESYKKGRSADDITDEDIEKVANYIQDYISDKVEEEENDPQK